MIDSLMNKSFWSILVVTLCLAIGFTAPISAADKKDEQAEVINLDDILGPLKKDYINVDKYKKAKVDYYKIRLLSDYEPGLTNGLWRSSSSKDIIKQLNNFTTPNGSPALRELWRTTLLDGFRGASVGSNKKDINLAIARMDTLMKLGLFHDAIRFYHAADKKPIPVGIADKAIDAMALAGMVDAACLEVQFVTQSIRSNEWLKKRALCAIRDGDKKTVSLLNDYLKDDLKDDAIHKSVARLLNRSTVNGPVKISLSPLQRALLLAHGGTLSHAGINKADPMLIASAAMSPYLSLQKKLKAANKAAKIGVIGPKELLAIYERVKLSNEQISGARSSLLSGKSVSNATTLAVITNTHELGPRSKAIERAVRQKTYRTNIPAQLYLKYVDKISSQAGDVPNFATTGYALAMWQDYLAASKAFEKGAQADLAILGNVSDIKIPESDEVDALLAFIDKRHPKSANIRKDRVLAALKAVKFVENDKIDPETLKSWKKGKKNASKKGIAFLEGLNELAVEKPGLSSPATIYQILENYAKNQFFEENRKITLEIIVQSVL